MQSILNNSVIEVLHYRILKKITVVLFVLESNKKLFE